jgi:predicted DNA-binding transcriptional regulator AlpA
MVMKFDVVEPMIENDSVKNKPPLLGVWYYNAKQICAMFGFSRTHLWRLHRSGDFPNPRQLGPNRVGWLASEVIAWAESRPPVEY